jgi:hypothetical protein
VEANLIRVHADGILTWKNWLLEFVPIVFDHLVPISRTSVSAETFFAEPLWLSGAVSENK